MDVIFHTTPLNFGTWQDFLQELSDRFEDKVSKQQARMHLKKYIQNSDVDQHINILNEFFMNAELTDAGEKIRLLEKSTNNLIIDVVYSDATGTLPTTYDLYVEKVLLIGRLQEKRRYQLNLERQSRFPTPHTPRTPAPNQPA